MAEHLGKDEKTYSEEYSSFTRELKSFHDQRGYVTLVFLSLFRINVIR